jgi:hypothetical protein
MVNWEIEMNGFSEKFFFFERRTASIAGFRESAFRPAFFLI